MKQRIILAVLLLQLCATHCLAKHIEILDSVADLDFNKGSATVTASYSILSDATYTSDLGNYRSKYFILKIINNDNPTQMKIKVIESSNRNRTAENPKTVKLPWWSKSAPGLLKNLDFSMVNGDATEYVIGKNYRLRLLARQEYWGKVYALERMSPKAAPQIICAMKLILSRTDSNVDAEKIHKPHATEINNNFIVATWNITAKPYGIIENDQDHFLLFMEYGQGIKERFASQKQDQTFKQLQVLIADVNAMHNLGYAHGDLNLRNILFIRDRLRLCDWYSLLNINETEVAKYRYIGNNLPPEAIRAFYFDKELGKGNADNLKYSLVSDQFKDRSYWLHPVAADRFSFGVSLLEIIAPEQHAKIDGIFKGLNPYAPESLGFWSKYVKNIRDVQLELINLAQDINKTDRLKAKLLYQVIEYIDLDPMKRLTII